MRGKKRWEGRKGEQERNMGEKYTGQQIFLWLIRKDEEFFRKP